MGDDVSDGTSRCGAEGARHVRNCGSVYYCCLIVGGGLQGPQAVVPSDSRYKTDEKNERCRWRKRKDEKDEEEQEEDEETRGKESIRRIRNRYPEMMGTRRI